MNILVIGLGSMGKRRVRNLQSLNYKNIMGFDTREDRRAEAEQKYSIATGSDFEKILEEFKPKVFVISTPPDLHMHYANIAYQNNIDCFIEASVVHADEIKELNENCKNKDIILAPSCTMRYFPGPAIVRKLIQEGAIGEPLNINYATGQYLPDWHPWEDIKDFYVSNRETGGCREIVPFELTWLNEIFGDPVAMAAWKGKLSKMEADIDDLYHFILKYGNLVANITVEVLSRPEAARELRIIGAAGIIKFSADSNSVQMINDSSGEWIDYSLNKGTVESQYINPEEPYIEEVKDFMMAVDTRNKSLYPNNLESDFKVLQVLYEIEKLADSVRIKIP